MKKTVKLALFSALIICLITAFALSAEAATYGDLTYTVSNGEVTITDCNTSATSVTIPEKINGYPVTKIGSYAFSGCTSITSITIPDSVTSIGVFAFDDTSYYNNSSKWKNGVLYIGNHLIKAKDTLSGSYQINSGTKSISSNAFQFCRSLTSITIPSGVTEIGSSAFRDCTSLKAVSFGGGSKCTSIGDYAFSGCTGLTSITIPSSVTSIGSSAFRGCTRLTSITIPSSVKSIGSSAFYGCTRLKSITIPSSVTSIGSSAFSGCTGLTSITIPSSVTSIESNAFNGCTSLASITIPSSVTSIGYEAFNGCSSLEEITLPFVGASATATGYESVFGYIFGYTTSRNSSAISGATYQYDSSFTYYHYYIPTSLKKVTITGSITIPSNAFYNCSMLTSITIPSSVTSIESNAFYNCTGLTSIAIPSSVTSIGSAAFYGCTGLSSITIPSSVTSIGASAFYKCTSLTSITIPDSVMSIGSDAFYNTSYYKSNWRDGVLYIGNHLIEAEDTLSGSYQIKSGTKTVSSSAFRGCTGLTSITIPSGVTEIGSSAFYGCTGLSSITIPSSVTSIGEAAFNDCSSIQSITIPNSVTSIGGGAFSGCTGLTSITIPNSVTSIGLCAFYGCTGLKTVTFEEGSKCTSIGASAFYNCTGLTSITIPSSVTSIESNAFYNCTGLKAASFGGGSKCTSIGEGAFYNCNGLKSITIPSSVTSIGYEAFKGCSSLEEITLPFVGASATATGYKGVFGYIFGYKTSSSSSAISGATYQYDVGSGTYRYYHYYIPTIIKKVTITGGTTIPVNAFYNCAMLSSITIPSSVTSIDSYAFRDCTSLTSITIPSSVISIGSYAFSGCTGLKTVTFEEESLCTSIGSYAFYNCTGLTSVNITDLAAWCNISFDDSYANPLYYVKNLYINGNLVTELVIPAGVTSIGSYAFYNCTSLTSVTIPSSVTSIGRFAFEKCTSLEEITLPFVGNTKDGTSDTHFGYIFGASSYSYNGSYVPASLKKVTITGGTAISKYAFYNCKSLTSITIPDSVTSIGGGAFCYCTDLTGITIPSSVTSISEDTFRDCTSLESITIPSRVRSIGDYAFCGCTGLTRITIPSSVTNIGEGAFSRCSSLTSITIPSSVTSIGDSAFSNCAGFTIYGYAGSYAETYAKNNGISFCNILVASGTCGKNLTWTLDENGLLTISGTGKMDDWLFSSIPWYLYLPSIKSVVINEGVTSIGDDAFYDCSSIQSITISSSVTSIGEAAFNDCSSIQSITIPNSVTSIGGGAFSGCTGLTSITIPNSVTSIGLCAFYGCTGLKTVTFEEGSKCTSIDGDAFYNCANLTSVNITDLAAWCNISFDDSYANPLYYAGNLYLNGNLVTDLVIPSSVISIGDDAFYNCKSLTSITIPDSVTSIGGGAFSGCTGLTSITIPNSVTSIGRGAFKKCTSLEEITLPFVGNTKDGTSYTHFGYIFGAYSYSENSSYVPTSLKKVIITGGTTIAVNAFYNCSGLTHITIPDSVESIGDYAFSGCTGLTSIAIPSKVTSIGYVAFYGCTGLAEIKVDEANTAFCDVNGILFNKNKTDLIVYPAANPENTYTIPSSVKSIYSYAFYNCTGLTSITISYGVTSIGSDAFSGCTNLKSITIPSSVTSIGSSAFYNCISLEGVYIGNITVWSRIHFEYGSSNPLHYAGNLYLNGVLVTDLTIPAGVRGIGSNAFNGCTSLESVTILYGVTSIGYDAFSNCANLTSVTIPSSVTSIGYEAFNGCSSLEEITLPFVGASANATLHESVFGYIFGYTTSSSSSAISGATYQYATVDSGTYRYYHYYIPESLKKVTIMYSISKYAFYNCSMLTEIVIPSSMRSIGDYAFEGCTGLKKVHITDLTAWCNISFGTSGRVNPLYHADLYLNGDLVTDLIIPSSVIHIGSSDFRGCTSLKTVTFEEGSKCTSIGASAFYNCTSLTSITIPNSVTSIGDSAFRGCTSLTIYGYVGSYAETYAKNNSIPFCNIIIASGSCGNNLTWTLDKNGLLTISGTGEMDDWLSSSIPWYSYCSLIRSVVINEGVTSIGDYAFYGCTSLTSITIPDSVTSIGSSAFCYCTDLTGITIPSSVTSIGWYAFNNCKSLTSVTIPSSVTSIGVYAFEYCESLEKVIFEEGSKCTSIGECAFPGCKSLKSIIFPDGLNYIGNNAFDSCTSLENIVIPSSVTSIGNSAFKNCINLAAIKVDENNTYYCDVDGVLFNKEKTTLIQYPARALRTFYAIPNSVTKMDFSAFQNSTNLESLTIPSSVTSIGKYTFYNCTSLKEVTFAEGSKCASIGDSAFYNCTSLTSITIPSSVTIIDLNAFLNCTSLTSITIPSSVTSIGSDAFYNCTSLKTVTFEEGSKCTSIGSSAFNRCTGLTSITIPSSVTSIGSSAFYGCTGLKTVPFEEESKCTSIGYSAFYGCTGLKSITIPSSVTSIGSSAFYKCTGLTSITIPSSVTSIDSYAFYYCTNLTIYGYAGSYVETYAYYYDIPFAVIHIVKFVDEDKNVLKSETFVYEAYILPPTAPAKSESEHYTYTFAGWDTNGDGNADTLPERYTDDITAIAVYTAHCKHIESKWIHISNTLEEYTCQNCQEVLDTRDGCVFENFVPTSRGHEGYCECGSIYASSSHTGGTATCTERKVCELCGASYGSLLPHNFDKEIAADEYLYSEATCIESAIYYKSCYCGAKYSKDNNGYISSPVATPNPNGALSATTSQIGGGSTEPSEENESTPPDTVVTQQPLPEGTFRYGEPLGHTGGTATCTELAVCTRCETPYGELLRHVYDKEVATQDYLKSKATCTEKAVYYKSCVCGDKGSTTFEHGTSLGHTGGTATCTELAVCTRCETHYGELLKHVYDKEVATQDYLKSKATCTEEAVYYNSCVCGDKGVTTFKHGEPLGHTGGTATCTALAVCTRCGAEYGKLLPHTYDREVVKDTYLKSKATCTEEAVYYNSCVCGDKGVTTFKYGEPLGHTGGTATCTEKAVCTRCGTEYGKLLAHTYDREVVKDTYLKSKATCTEEAVYYNSCVCGDKGVTTFKHGEPLGHISGEKICTRCGTPLIIGTISGTVTSFGDETAITTIELLDGEAVLETQTVIGNTGSYSFDILTSGGYTIRVSKSKHCTREYKIAVTGSDVIQNVEIWLYGDVTGEGIINNVDVLQIDRKIAKLSSIFDAGNDEDKEYRLNVANVTAVNAYDTILNNLDVLQINRKIANLSSVFDLIN